MANSTEADDGEEPVAGLSAASSCVRFSLQGTIDESAGTKEGEGGGSGGVGPSSPGWFRPVYTHQCFEGEFLPGWRPTKEAEGESSRIHCAWKGRCGAGDDDEDGDAVDAGGSGLHPSHERRLQTSRGRIDVRVSLAPSCEACRIEVDAEEGGDADGGDEPEPERAKKKAKKVSFGGIEEPGKDEAGDGASHEPSKLSVGEVIKKMSSALPPVSEVTVNGIPRGDLAPEDEGGTGIQKPPSGYLSDPVGRVLRTYRRKVRTDGDDRRPPTESEFVLALADGSDPTAKRYHDAVQPLARWFVETADDIDVSDESRGTWKVLYLFRRHAEDPTSASRYGYSRRMIFRRREEDRYGLAGYATLLHVHSPFRKPDPGVVVRVCQVLVLPPYHRAGHGSEMLRCVHEYADDRCGGEGMGVVEVNVEDPAPAFVALREKVDYRRFRELCASSSGGGRGTGGDVSDKQNDNGDELDLGYLNDRAVTEREYFLPVSDERLIAVARALKITKRQSQAVHELRKMDEIEEWKRSLGGPSNAASNDGADRRRTIEEVETSYRLMAKRSLRSCRLEELGACEGGKEGQKALLGRWFEETLARYRGILGLK
ncbi:hypothetical protein ACHAWF_002181 [Thalassiosira exigua]